jgi:hypothetical protein
MANSLFDIASFSTQKGKSTYPALSTARISPQSKEVQKLLQITKKWSENISSPKCGTQKIDAKTLRRIVDNNKIIKAINEDLEREEGYFEYFIAFTLKNMQLQAIGQLDVGKCGGHELRYLASNPANSSFLQKDRPVRGAGTAIIRRICHEMHTFGRLEKKELFTTALTCSGLFFKKLGFQGTNICHLSSYEQICSLNIEKTPPLQGTPSIETDSTSPLFFGIPKEHSPADFGQFKLKYKAQQKLLQSSEGSTTHLEHVDLSKFY